MSVGQLRAESDSVQMRVPFQAPSAATARAALKDWLSRQGVSGEVVDDARVVISELVGNSVRHAHPLPNDDLLISWCLDDDGALVISVSDGGSITSPHKVQADGSAVSGRGLTIVEALADRWWIEDARTQSTVHVRMRL